MVQHHELVARDCRHCEGYSILATELHFVNTRRPLLNDRPDVPSQEVKLWDVLKQSDYTVYLDSLHVDTCLL
jgi:hypothetical protein